MSIEKVKEYLAKYEAADRVLELDQSSATVDLAAAALGCDPARIAKTLSFNVNEAAVLIVSAGDVKVDNAKFKTRFNTKAKMLTPQETVAKTGLAVGGVCPFAVNEGVDIYLDESLRRFDAVYPACGSSNSAICLTIPELERYSNALGWVDVTKLKFEMKDSQD